MPAMSVCLFPLLGDLQVHFLVYQREKESIRILLSYLFAERYGDMEVIVDLMY